jgi:Arc/MetJ-type ribon-helix-helix transcriptional regulator
MVVEKKEMVSARVPKSLKNRLEELVESLTRKTGKVSSVSDVLRTLVDDPDGPAAQLDEEDRFARNPAKYMEEIGGAVLSGGQLSVVAYKELTDYICAGLTKLDWSTSPVSIDVAKTLTSAFLSLHKLSMSIPSKDDDLIGSNLLRIAHSFDFLWKEQQEFYVAEQPLVGPELGEEVQRRYQVLHDSFDVSALEKRKYVTSYPCEAEYRNCFVNYSADALQLLLSSKKFSAAELNNVLRPYLNGLWRLAARGYYYSNKQPIRVRQEQLSLSVDSGCKDFKSDDGFIRVSVIRDRSGDISTLLNLNDKAALDNSQQLHAMFGVSRYPAILDMIRLIAAAEGVTGIREVAGPVFTFTVGEDFYTIRHTEHESMRLSLSKDNWRRVAGLYLQIIEDPDIAPRWERFRFEYGEV